MKKKKKSKSKDRTGEIVFENYKNGVLNGLQLIKDSLEFHVKSIKKWKK